MVFGMRSDKLDKRDASAEIECNNHPKITAGDFEPCALTVQDLCVWSRKTNIIHRTPIGGFDQRSPTMKRDLRLGVPIRVSRKHAPGDNSHSVNMFPKREQRKGRTTKNGGEIARRPRYPTSMG
jgi:hypothetical protein